MAVRSYSTEGKRHLPAQNGPPEPHPEESPLLSAFVPQLLMKNIPTVPALLVKAVPGLRPNAPRRNALVVLCYLVLALFVLGLLVG